MSAQVDHVEDESEVEEDEDEDEDEDSTDNDFEVVEEIFSDIFSVDDDGSGEVPGVPDAAQVNNEERIAKAHGELKILRALQVKSLPRTVDVAGKRHRKGIAGKWKKLAKRLRGEGKSFTEVQREVYEKSSGVVFVSTRHQLHTWCAKEYQRGTGSCSRVRGKKPQNALSTELLAWFKAQRENRVAVSVTMLKRKAASLNVGGDDLPRCFVSRWRARNCIVMRSIQRRTTKSPEQLRALIQSFHSYVYSARLQRSIRIFVNFDEIPVSFSGSMHGGGTLEFRGTTDVLSSTDTNWDKRCGSFIPILVVVQRSIGFDVVRVPSCFLLRRSAKKMWRLLNPQKWLIEQTDSGVVTTHFISEVMLPWLTDILKPLRADEKDTPLLIFDSASAHHSKTSLGVARTSFVVAVIPGGCTQFVQPVDTVYAATFRRVYSQDYFQPWAASKPGKLTAFQYCERMLQWMVEAHSTTIDKCDVAKCFQQTGITTSTCISIRGLLYNFDPPDLQQLPAETIVPHPNAAVQQTIVSLFTRVRDTENDVVFLREVAAPVQEVQVGILVPPPPVAVAKKKPGRPATAKAPPSPSARTLLNVGFFLKPQNPK